MNDDSERPGSVDPSITVQHLLSPTRDEVEGLTVIFDDYRAHYGQTPSASETGQWLEANFENGRLDAFVATSSDVPVGFALTTIIPASLRLRHFWQIRDLFVARSHRQRGVAGLLLNAVHDAAIRSGALRVSLQTESDNAAALRLYARHGYATVEGYLSLTLSLEPDSPET